jgi:hypothetical protein
VVESNLGRKEANMLWMAIDTSKYELPIAVGGNAKELGAMLGVSERVIYVKASRREKTDNPRDYSVIKIKERG